MLALGCVGSLDAGPRAPGDAPTCVIGETGAPVPMRRLTAEQVVRSVHDALGLARDGALTVTDERVFTYRSNISSSIDLSGARGYLDFAESTSARVDVSRCASTACLDWLLDDVGMRLFRRPLDGGEHARYAALFDDGQSAGGGEEGARWVIQALLQSPTFLYLDEVADADGTLDDYSVAARLSLTLWGAGPDQALLATAARGELSSAAQVRAEASRMLDDPRSAGGLTDFVDQWLQLQRLDDPSARPDLAALGTETVAALRSEPPLFVRGVVLGGGDLRELLTATETPTLAPLAAIYADDIVGSRGDLTQLDPDRRAGLLTLPGVQAALAHAGTTSPTLRGFEVLSGFLCTPPDPPPAGVSTTLAPPTPDETTRQRLERHFSSPSCASCHRGMDGIGFSFESFDWLGRSRSEEGGRPIDDAGEFQLGTADVTVDGPIDLADRMADTRQVSRCIARQWTQYATGVPPTGEAACLLDAMATDLRSEAGLREMILQQVSSDWFRRRQETP